MDILLQHLKINHKFLDVGCRRQTCWRECFCHNGRRHRKQVYLVACNKIF